MKKVFSTAIYVMATLVMVFAMGSCKKEKSETRSNEQQATPVDGLLHFNSAEEFLETQQKVTAMNEAERRNWEQQQGFKSFATKCYELIEEFEAKGISSEEDVYSFVNKNGEYFYILDENGEKTVKCHLSVSPYFYLVNEERLVQMESQCMKAFEEGVVYGSVNYLDEIKQIHSFSKHPFPDNLSFVQLNSSVQDINQHSPCLLKGDSFLDLGNTTSYKGLRAIRTSSTEGNRNNIELLVMETYYPPMELIPAQYYTRLYIHNYPEHRVAGMWFPCQRRKNFDVSVKWTTWGYYSPVTQATSFTVIDDGGYNTYRDIEVIPMQINGYSFDRFNGSAYTYDTPSMMNFDSDLSHFGLY